MKTLYTVIFGPYDDLKRIKVKTPGWQYVCFTDQPLKSDDWIICKCGPIGGARHQAKLLKILQPVNGLSIYIDGSFVPNCDLDKFVDRHHIAGKVSFMRHPTRHCVYDEIEACKDLGKDSSGRLDDAVKYLRRLGVPDQMGLPASGVIIRDIKSDFLQDWVDSLMISARDQISWAAAAYRHPNDYHLFNYNYLRDTDFLYIPHLKDNRRQKYIQAHESHGYHQLIDCAPRV